MAIRRLLVLGLAVALIISAVPAFASDDSDDDDRSRSGDGQGFSRSSHDDDDDTETVFRANLLGSAEVPNPPGGDPDGFGQAKVVLDAEDLTICYRIKVFNVALPITAAHIHTGAAGVAGAPLVTFNVTPTSLKGCVTGVPIGTIQAIRQNPGNYYVNVHNTAFPNGAIRGQLDGSLFPRPRAHAGTLLRASLTGAAGSGKAFIVLNEGQGRVCSFIVVRNIATAVTAAHIHLGTLGETVPPLVGLGILGGGFPWMWHGFGEGRFDDDFFESATAQFLSGCTTGVPAATIQAIRQNPANYMVNVHTGTAIALQGPLMAKKDH